MFSLPAFLALALFAPWPIASDDDPQAPDPPRIIAWNDLGMHCIDPDFSVFSILPPYNNIHSQLVLNGQLQPGSGFTVTYSAVPDPIGSINRTSIGKTNFWDHVQDLFGTTLPLDVGLAGFAMPGPANIPQPMSFDPAWRWFFAEGLPYTPLDDALQKNPYPLLEVIAKNQSGQVIASTVTTVPNSEELDCRQCHASGSSAFARPSGGWVFDPDPLKDDRFNILRLHDELHLGDPTYQAALVTAGYNSAGMFATVKQDGVAILCDRCHASNALPGTGISGIKPLTEVMHGFHANVVNPLGQRLDDITDRSACYSCHPGFDTQCLRGAMGKAIGADGDFQMQCQSCHGSMSTVGLPGRDGWFDEPTCQNCHTGSAVQNAGQIRFTSVYDSPGHRRDAVTNLFATEPDVPIPGSSLYRFSEGHGNLQCSACHGPPHAIYPTSEVNDNLQSEQIQGHVGTITECSSCHGDREDNELFGPHGMHPATQDWASGKHGDFAEHNLAQCQACHGADSRGTELSFAQADRSFSTRFGTKTFFRGARVGCYHCHNGPTNENGINNQPPVVGDLSLSTPNDVPLSIPLSGTDLDGDTLTIRIVSQPQTRTGTVAFDGATATYLPPAGFIGTASFTYSAWDGKTNSNLGTVTVSVGAASCPGSVESYGFPCPGSGDLLPLLSVEGCPAPGGNVTVTIENAYGGGTALLLIGADRATIVHRSGCVLRIQPLLLSFGPLPLAGSGPGQGTLTLPVPVPPNAPAKVTVQALLTDPGVSRGWTLTNAIEVKTQ